jgi:hypothetical protein
MRGRGGSLCGKESFEQDQRCHWVEVHKNAGSGEVSRQAEVGTSNSKFWKRAAFHRQEGGRKCSGSFLAGEGHIPYTIFSSISSSNSGVYASRRPSKAPTWDKSTCECCRVATPNTDSMRGLAPCLLADRMTKVAGRA